MNERSLVITIDNGGKRLDVALANELSDFSRAQCQRLIKEGNVTVNGHVTKPSHRLEGGEHIEIVIQEPVQVDLVAEPIPLDVRYEDQDIILINKAAGMVVHPAAGHESGTLVNAVLARCPDLSGVGGEKRPGIVHRLDKETSGLIIVAKNDQAMRYLQQQFKEGRVGKKYLALVDGQLQPAEMLIDAPIGRDKRDRKKMAVIAPGSSARGRLSQTRIKLLDQFDGYSLVECRPLTGRTHQIRVHLAFAGFPISGDKIYGRRKNHLSLARQFLHAAEIEFQRPSDGKKINFSAELPQELQTVLDTLIR
jgi:23S rRNA pseudouridine1911/1915/1917 synthase